MRKTWFRKYFFHIIEMKSLDFLCVEKMWEIFDSPTERLIFDHKKKATELHRNFQPLLLTVTTKSNVRISFMNKPSLAFPPFPQPL